VIHESWNLSILMNDCCSEKKCCPCRGWLTTLVIIGCLLIFLVGLRIIYSPIRPDAPGYDVAEQRKLTLSSNQAKQRSKATTYGWENRSKGVVRVPIEHAMTLTIEELARQQANR